MLSLLHQKEAIPLPVSRYWSKSFKCDIRRALLHLQCSLTTPSCPPLLPPYMLTWRNEATPTDNTTSICPTLLTQHPLALPTHTHTQCTWERKACATSAMHHHSNMGMVSELMSLSDQCDYKSSVDCLRGESTYGDTWIPRQPYNNARLLPGNLDKHPKLTPGSHIVSHDIFQEVHRLGLWEEPEDMHSTTNVQ